MTSRGFRFDVDTKGIEDVLESPGVAKHLTAAARAVADKIERFAPRRRAFMDYRRSIRAIPASQGSDGLEAAAGVDSPTWHLPEYGTARYPARSPIRRAAAEVVDRFEEGR